MTAPLLTIGMATYDDFHGVWATIQSLRLHQCLQRVELLVVDNHPGSAHGEAVRKLMHDARHGNAGARYVEQADPVGNAVAKNRVMAEARGEWVLVMDCHVLLPHGVIGRLKSDVQIWGDSQDLYQGPCITGGSFTPMTHWRDEYGNEMWGKWGQDPRGANAENPPFEIDGMGGGFFLCRRDSWLPFHAGMRGFGGESMYLQRKWLKHGRKVWCVPYLRWLHRYPRPDGIPFPLRRDDKIRNQMIGHLELGLPLDRLRSHICGERGMSSQEWDRILAEARAVI
jgi:hypothetical protein